MTDMTKLGKLVFYAVDKASPRSLALESGVTLATLEDTGLRDLGVMDEGLKIMWAIINDAGPGYAGSAPVPEDEQGKCDTVGDVWNAVCKASAAVSTAGEFL
jgi:hypothetical protein